MPLLVTAISTVALAVTHIKFLTIKSLLLAGGVQARKAVFCFSSESTEGSLNFHLNKHQKWVQAWFWLFSHVFFK